MYRYREKDEKAFREFADCLYPNGVIGSDTAALKTFIIEHRKFTSERFESVRTRADKLRQGLIQFSLDMRGTQWKIHGQNQIHLTALIHALSLGTKPTEKQIEDLERKIEQFGYACRSSDKATNYYRSIAEELWAVYRDAKPIPDMIRARRKFEFIEKYMITGVEKCIEEVNQEHRAHSYRHFIKHNWDGFLSFAGFSQWQPYNLGAVVRKLPEAMQEAFTLCSTYIEEKTYGPAITAMTAVSNRMFDSNAMYLVDVARHSHAQFYQSTKANPFSEERITRDCFNTIYNRLYNPQNDKGSRLDLEIFEKIYTLTKQAFVHLKETDQDTGKLIRLATRLEKIKYLFEDCIVTKEVYAVVKRDDVQFHTDGGFNEVANRMNESCLSVALNAARDLFELHRCINFRVRDSQFPQREELLDSIQLVRTALAKAKLDRSFETVLFQTTAAKDNQRAGSSMKAA